MRLIERIKAGVERLPEPISRPLSAVPFSVRFGPVYSRGVGAIARSEQSTSVEREQLLLERLRSLLSKTIRSSKFYRDVYGDAGVRPETLRSLDDWRQVPVVTKAAMQALPLSERAVPGAKGFKVNTGGTSGQPLEFQLDRGAFAREWAHMHHIWKARGYRPSHLKLTFRGKHFDGGQPLRYNAVHNEYVVNASATMESVVEAVLRIPPSRIVRWLHGYPSLVAEFAQAFRAVPDGGRDEFRSRLFGVLLGSEFPAPIYRDVIEEVLSVNVVSWYGHSEMAVLARETARGVYESMPTYGYAEAVPTEDGQHYRLVCTSLHNTVHPFIRYDTGDLIEPIAQYGGALAFRISEGRVGDFILDRVGRKHSLTALIFGRHHEAFELIEHLQVREDQPGHATLVVTPRNQSVDLAALRRGFDLSGVQIEWKLELVDSPVRTPSGKIRLKVQ